MKKPSAKLGSDDRNFTKRRILEQKPFQSEGFKHLRFRENWFSASFERTGLGGGSCRGNYRDFRWPRLRWGRGTQETYIFWHSRPLDIPSWPAQHKRQHVQSFVSCEYSSLSHLHYFNFRRYNNCVISIYNLFINSSKFRYYIFLVNINWFAQFIIFWKLKR